MFREEIDTFLFECLTFTPGELRRKAVRGLMCHNIGSFCKFIDKHTLSVTKPKLQRDGGNIPQFNTYPAKTY